jgi:membrane-associated protease RseP (regulator of RpoE activity)
MACARGAASRILVGMHPPPEAGFPPEVLEAAPVAPAADPIRWRLALALFGVTLLTTLLAGALQRGGDPLHRPADLILGIPFSFTLMTILLVHEMGHYLTARRHHVAVTLPYFIPMPVSFIGTMGAFIRIRQQIPTKRALIDIGASGPLAGFVVAIVAVAVGIPLSVPMPVGAPDLTGGLRLGDSLIFAGLVKLFGVPVPEGSELVLHPAAFAGWVGLFVTCLNLLPVGQLDGGHVAYAVLGRRQRAISRVVVVALLVAGAFGWRGWLVWGVLIFVLGTGHPPTMDEYRPLDPARRRLGWISLAVFVLTFTPTPFALVS